MKTLYEVNWHSNNDTLIRISVTPIKVLREGILPGCSAVSITAVDSNGRLFQGCPQNYFETEEAAWEKTKIELQESIAEEEYIISEAQRRIEGLRNVLLAIQGAEPVRETGPAVQGELVGYIRRSALELMKNDELGVRANIVKEPRYPDCVALYTAPQPAEPDEERLAMEAVMESIDPATWPGLTLAQRCALGRFAKPQPAEQQPAPDVLALVEALEAIQKAATHKNIHTGIQAGTALGCIAAICDVVLATHKQGGEV